ncbi:hypothetical protein NP233_g5069 [Leucocoprinus birnbaumii]|uniref:F-box domain-containing protein n=1 Tax=Leucocoprinus birnbaumii TaxID=56174 RepID=A0AAD5YWR0_9AGAR|nr:hypothetical protein NP233_g5069 [Leucocoprinus birnbaumii]
MDLHPEEIDDLHLEAKNLDFTIQHLTERRSYIMRQLNAAKCATRALPTETLRNIFELACIPLEADITTVQPVLWNNRSRTALKFSHVCSRWRKVAFSTPALWQTIAIILQGHQDIQRIADIFALHAQNVGILPLSVFFGAVAGVSSQLGPIGDVLLKEEYSQKIEVLILREFFAREWLYHITPKFQRLKKFICDESILRGEQRIPQCYAPPPDPAPTISARNIQSLTLSRMPATLENPSETVTVVTLQNLDVAICAQVLFHCPNLIKYECYDIQSNTQSTLSEPQISTLQVRPHLTSFTWSFGWTSWDEAIIQHLRLPALKTLSWHSMVSMDEMNDFLHLFLPFLSSARETLEELQLDGSNEFSLQNFVHLLTPLKNVHELSTRVSYIMGIPEQLFLALEEPLNDSQNKVLPHLEYLCITSDGIDYDDFRGQFDHLAPAAVQMLNSRLAGSQANFLLQVDDSDIWSKEFQEQVWTLIEGGANLEIHDREGKVEWLDSNNRDVEVVLMDP